MQVSLDLATAAAAHARLQADMRDQAAAASFKYQKLEKVMEAAAHRADMEHAAHAMQQTQQQTNKHSRKQPNTAAFCGMATNSEYSQIGVGQTDARDELPLLAHELSTGSLDGREAPAACMHLDSAMGR
jgi:hypothetical protein